MPSQITDTIYCLNRRDGESSESDESEDDRHSWRRLSPYFERSEMGALRNYYSERIKQFEKTISDLETEVKCMGNLWAARILQDKIKTNCSKISKWLEQKKPKLFLAELCVLIDREYKMFEGFTRRKAVLKDLVIVRTRIELFVDNQENRKLESRRSNFSTRNLEKLEKIRAFAGEHLTGDILCQFQALRSKLIEFTGY